MRPYLLPELRYGHGSLEPHIWGKALEAHHLSIHQGYVDGANDDFTRLVEARNGRDFEHLGAIERSLAFNLSGHVLHSIFWQNLAPDGGDRPAGELAAAIDFDFGSFERFRQMLVQTAMAIRGSGWAALAWDPLGKRLQTVQIKDHQLGLVQGTALLMLVDAWEHAYFAQYRADKRKYFESLFKLWDWDDITERFERARELDLGLERPARPKAVKLEVAEEPPAEPGEQVTH
ncbi:MAG: superoxide dismutase [Myxococcaceae bacterium]